MIGLLERTPEERTVNKVFKKIPEGKNCLLERKKKTWLDGVENDMKKTVVISWRKIARGRAAWKLILKAARALPGP
jgi:hypothetical protein